MIRKFVLAFTRCVVHAHPIALSVSCMLLLAGCGDMPLQPMTLQHREDALVPVNLLLNSGQILDVRMAEELIYLQKQITNSGLFAGVQVGTSPWPYTLRADANIDCSMGIGEAAGAIAASATMFIVPHTETCVYSIKAAFFEGAKLIDTRNYSTPYKKTIDVFGHTQVRGDQEGLDAVYAKMLDDCLKNPPLPRAKATKAGLDL